MKYPLLEPATTLAAGAVVFGTLALGVGKPAWGATPVTEEQATAAAVAARALDDSASENSDMEKRTVEPFAWSAASESSAAWYPGAGVDDTGATDTGATDNLTSLSASPMQTHLATSGAMLGAQEASVIPNEHAVIPLPAGAWTGLAGLTSLATIRARKAIVRFFT